MALDQKKYDLSHETVLRDTRPFMVRFALSLREPIISTSIFLAVPIVIYMQPSLLPYFDIFVVILLLYFWWITGTERHITYKLPLGSPHKDLNNMGPGKNGEAEGILYLGNEKRTGDEAWFSNSDARTHILYLGTTGAGKTEGLKSMVTNAMSWGSGFVYVDGKADTDLWSSLSSLLRRFGRDDDLLVLNYMTGNSDTRSPSNTMNPFSSGSASYLTQMLVSLMPDSGGDNAMWKERAVSLVGAIMPALTWRRDYQDTPMSVTTIREYLNLNKIIQLSREDAIPEDIKIGIKGYLDTLPGYMDAVFDDNGDQKPPGPDVPQVDTGTVYQQHGFLSMQFTRSLQSLGDEYGYIFDTQSADVDMVDVVLNRRVLVVLIPALEKSGDETANLGKIVAASIKGMMGSTLGATVEGSSATVIENKPTNSSTPFMTVFDEVGYYTAEGMAVMAAQARSLGFCLIYAAQDLPALQKRVKEEAKSITANCNIKIFGKLEDPTETKEFFDKTVGEALVTEISSYSSEGGGFVEGYGDGGQANVVTRQRASYSGLRGFKEGEAIITFGEVVADVAIFYSNPGHAKAMRVTRFMGLPPPDEDIIRNNNAIVSLRDSLVNDSWTAKKADVAIDTPEAYKVINDEINASKKTFDHVDSSIIALCSVHAIDNEVDLTPTSPSPPPPVKKEAAPVPVSAPVANKKMVDKKPGADSKSESGSSPMSFFGSAPKSDDKSTEGKKRDNVVSLAPAADKEAEAEVKSETDSKSDSPMSFFGSAPKSDDKSAEAKKVDAPVIAAPVAPIEVEQKVAETTDAKTEEVISVKEDAIGEVVAAPVVKAVKLDEQVEAIIRNSAKAAGEQIFKEGKDDK